MNIKSILFLAVIICLAGCTGSDSDGSDSRIDTLNELNAEEFVETVGIILPEKTDDFEASQECALDCLFGATFKIDISQVDEIVNNNDLEVDQRSTDLGKSCESDKVDAEALKGTATYYKPIKGNGYASKPSSKGYFYNVCTQPSKTSEKIVVVIGGNTI